MICKQPVCVPALESLETRTLMSSAPLLLAAPLPQDPAALLLQADPSAEPAAQFALGDGPVVGAEPVIIPGMSDSGWGPSVCFVASIGQLLLQADPTLSANDILLRSGFLTEADWRSVQGEGMQLRYHHLDNYDGPRLDVAHFGGMSYNIISGGAGGRLWVRGADSYTRVRTQEAAVAALKGLLDDGKPVMVHVDMQYLAADASVQIPFWGWPQNQGHSISHFMVVHGYDDQYIYYTDNGTEVGRAAGQDGTAIRVRWESFIAGWEAERYLADDSNFRGGPWFMTYLGDAPRLASDEFMLKTLSTYNAHVPVDLRAAATAIERGAGRNALPDFLMSRFKNMRNKAAALFTEMGLGAIADLYAQSSVLWGQVDDLGQDVSAAPALLRQIADLEQQALTLMGQEAADAPMIELLNDFTQPIEQLQDTIFRFAVNPAIRNSLSLEFSDDPNFADPTRIVKVSVRAGARMATLTVSQWKKVIALDGAGRSVHVRVSQNAKGVVQRSEAVELTWDAMAITATGPADGTTLAIAQPLVLNYAAPVFTLKPKLVVSTTADFSNPLGILRISISPRATTATIKASKLEGLLRQLEGETVTLYWRLEDASAATSTVGATATFELNVQRPLSAMELSSALQSDLVRVV